MIPLITLFCLSVSHPGLVSLLLLFPGSNCNLSIVLSTLKAIARYHLCINFSMVCHKVLFLVLSSPSCTLLLSALLFLTHLQIITSKQMTLNFSYLISAASNSHDIEISSVSNWLSANFLTLNISKNEFLIIGLPQQLSKLSSPSIRLPKNMALSPVDSSKPCVIKISLMLNTSLLFQTYVS